MKGVEPICPAGFVKTAWRKPSKNKLSSSFKHLGMRTHEWNLIFCSWLRRFQHAKSCFNCIHLFSPGYGGEQSPELFSLVWEMSFWKGREGCRHCSLQQFAAVLHLLLFWAGLWPGHISGLTLLRCEVQPQWGRSCEKWGQSKLQQSWFPIFLFVHLFQRPKVLFLWDYFSF